MPIPVRAVDDISIPDDAVLWRRVRFDQCTLDECGKRRPSSQAFQDIEQDGITAMSAHWEQLEIEAGRTHRDFLEGFRAFGVAAIGAELVRSCGLKIVRAPKEGNPGHVHIVGKKTGAIRTKLAKGARWIQEPPPRPTG